MHLSSNQSLTGGGLEINFEYSKIAPQNIMYDRRVVRGNTFAALVIPVSKAYLPFLTLFRYATRSGNA